MASTVQERSSFLTLAQDTITVEVGEEKKPFIVHKDLLCYWSKYFDKALNGSFQEAGSSMIPVTDVDPNIFACFMQWLYAQPSVPSQDEPEESAKPVGGSQNSYQEPSIEPGHFHDVFKMLLKLYIFGDRYDICDLRKDVMTFEKLPHSSPYCRFWIDRYAYRWDPSKDNEKEKERHEKLPPKLLYEIMIINTRRARAGDSTQPADLEDPCRYHDHTNSKEANYCRMQLPQRMVVWGEMVKAWCMKEDSDAESSHSV